MTASGPLVLLVEDEAPMRRLLRAALTAHGYRVVEAADAAEGRSQAAAYNPELVLLDLGLPDATGREVLRAMREWSSAPVIVLSASAREEDKVASLDEGADDYLTKPFGTGELLARIRVALRHAERVRHEPDQAITVGELRIDLARRRVFARDEEVHLTPLEYKLFAALMKNAGKVMTHRQLLLDVWGPTHAGQLQYVRVYMVQLRNKLERDPARPRYLVTEQGVGYRLRDDGA